MITISAALIKNCVWGWQFFDPLYPLFFPRFSNVIQFCFLVKLSVLGIILSACKVIADFL